MKKSTSNPIFKKLCLRGAPAIRTLQLPHNYEQILQRAQEFYHARGGMTGMTLNDWLKAEQELKQQCGK